MTDNTQDKALMLPDQELISADQNPAAIYLASLGAKQSRETMLGALTTIAEIISQGQHNAQSLPWGALRFQHTQAIRTALKERFKHTTANKMLSALRGVLKVAYRLGQMSSDDYARASDIKAIKGQSAPAGRDIAQGEIIALVQVCKDDKTPAGARDAALLGVMYTCGLRRAELAGLDLADVDTTSGKITVRSGKGNKDRTVYITNGALRALKAWIDVRGQNAGPLFLEVHRGGHIQHDKRLTPQAVYGALKKRGEEAGVQDFSPHDMRRTFVGDLLDRGADIATVAKLAGHSSVTTTARYDRRDEETKQKASNLLHFPF